MLYVQDIFEQIITELGQDDYVDASVFEIDLTKCIRLAKSVLGVYNKYIPHDEYGNYEITGGMYTFTGKIPKFLSKVTPSSNNFLVSRQYLFDSLGVRSMASQVFLWEYRKPVLHCIYDGEVEVRSVFDHEIFSVTENGTTTHIIDTLEYTDHLFFDLLKAKMMQSIGRNRKAFTINDLPMTSDADSLVSDGITKEQETMQMLQDNSKSYLAWG